MVPDQRIPATQGRVVPSDNSEYLNKSKKGTTAVVENGYEEKIPPTIQENDHSDIEGRHHVV